MRIEIGIPLLSGVALARELIEEAIKLKSPSKFHLSVNDPGIETSDYKALEELDPRVKVTCQPVNLGLYGNFRFLVRNAECEFFHWHCFDDSISDEALLDASAQISSTDADLAVIPFFEQECYLDPIRWTGPKSEGKLPNLSNRNECFMSSIYAQPSWIFGLWKTESLGRAFPSQDFDWLDTHILQKILTQGRVIRAQTESPMTIGTWVWKNKVPNAVDGKTHKAGRSLVRSGILFLSKGYLFKKSEISLFVIESRNRIALARKLTVQLTDQRK